VSPRRPDADVPPGLLLVDKPGGMTSHDVVARARRALSVRRVGHAGTLDPMATGLLILGVGAATRLLGHVGGSAKTYEATIRLGQSTVTDDREGEVLTTASAAHLTEDDVRAALAAQTGPLRQVPSSVSAVKVAGRRSYDRVRAGEQVLLSPRAVTVHRLDVHGLERPTPDLVDVAVTVECSAGTYIRAIARDAGAALGVGGHLTALRRTASGPFDVADAAPVEDAAAALTAGGGAGALLLTAAARRVWPERALTSDEARALGYGQRIPATGRPGLVAAVDPAGRLVALVEDAGETARVAVGFPPA
jgi:tRNA pseudouridine55 synthase